MSKILFYMNYWTNLLIVIILLSACTNLNIGDSANIQNLKLIDDGLEVSIGDRSIIINLSAPDGGDLSGLKISTVQLSDGHLVFIFDPDEKYLPEIRYLTSQTPSPIRMLLRLGQYSPYSLHFEHQINLETFVSDIYLEGVILQDLQSSIDLDTKNNINGLLIAMPETLTETSSVNLYKTYLPGIFFVAPVDGVNMTAVANLLVITFHRFPDNSITSIIEAELGSVNIANMVGLSLDDIAGFQYLSDNPDVDPDLLIPFGEKTLNENYNEILAT